MADIEILKQRVLEKDFEAPSMKQFLAAVIGVPAVIFLIQLLYPKFGRTMPELPTLKEFLIFTGIGYAGGLLLLIYDFTQRRKARLEAEKTTGQVPDGGSRNERSETEN